MEKELKEIKEEISKSKQKIFNLETKINEATDKIESIQDYLECQAKILDEVIKEKNENDNPYLLTGEELKRTEEARIRGEK